MSIIRVEHVNKSFTIYKRKPGLVNTITSLIHRKYERKDALRDVSFSIEPGEMVGYIGPNGAGKSTTIKILSGILVPSSGLVEVNGIAPWEHRSQNALRIGVVFGQRSHLHWDLPVMDSYELYQKMYRIEKKRFRENVAFFTDKLSMGDFINKPVRQLSLGQKMRAEIASALLHDPDIVYLDEPTIGLDVMAKGWIREFLREVNRERKITVILTTHDMDDIEEICDRLIMIDDGSIRYDGSIGKFKAGFAGELEMCVSFRESGVRIEDPRLRLVRDEDQRQAYAFSKKCICMNEILALINHHEIKDLYFKEPGIEAIVRDIYTKKQPGPTEILDSVTKF